MLYGSYETRRSHEAIEATRGRFKTARCRASLHIRFNRGEAKEDSDVDLFFDYEKGNLGLFELMDVKEYAASILGHKADIMTRNSLHPRLRKQIEESAVLVF
jgi:predicted nucleotidyltransferase